MAPNTPLSFKAQSYRVAGAMAMVLALSLGAAGWLSHHHHQRYQQPRYEPSASLDSVALELRTHQFGPLTFQLPTQWEPAPQVLGEMEKLPGGPGGPGEPGVFVDPAQRQSRLLVRQIKLDSPATLDVALEAAVQLEIPDEDLPTFSTVHLWVKEFGPKSATRLLAISKAPRGLTLHHLLVWTVDHQTHWLFYTRLVEPTGRLDTDQTVALDRFYASLALMAQEK